HRLDSNRWFELIHQRRARHSCFAINQHRAGSANFLQAIRIVGDRSGLLAVARHWILRNVAQANNDVHRRPPFERKLFPSRGLSRPRLPFHSDRHLFSLRHTSSTTTSITPEPTATISL